MKGWCAVLEPPRSLLLRALPLPDTMALIVARAVSRLIGSRLRRKPTMKRWFLTVAALLGMAAGLAHAEYVIIIANLGQSKAPPPPAGGGEGVPGGPGVGGPPGLGGPPPGMGAVGGRGGGMPPGVGGSAGG